MKLKPKIGIDNLKFGMSRNEVVEILGEPSRVIIDPSNENDIILEWSDKLLRLTFYQNENDRFGYIRTKNPDLTYNGKKIINSKVDYVKKEVFGDLVKEWEVDDFKFLITHFDIDLWINLDEEYGIVTDFELGVPFLNDIDYDWPI
ncbi:hypothetical protein [Altibacter lentus]|uniref:hypothetical protein n=1 Tax=Altibacter lentus TaxID=1223410 RepID=UPI00054F56D7|nr:hypothetical protein [Altibacter lentus]